MEQKHISHVLLWNGYPNCEGVICQFLPPSPLHLVLILQLISQSSRILKFCCLYSVYEALKHILKIPLHASTSQFQTPIQSVRQLLSKPKYPIPDLLEIPCVRQFFCLMHWSDFSLTSLISIKMSYHGMADFNSSALAMQACMLER